MITEAELLKKSVTFNNFLDFQSLFIDIGQYNNNDYLVSPDRLPTSWQSRDRMFQKTFVAPQWATAVKIATVESAKIAPIVESRFLNRTEQVENVMSLSGFGVGWAGYIQGLRDSYIKYNNGWFSEVVRSSKSRNGRVIGFVQLPSWNCERTGDPRFPVKYRGQNGEVVLKDYQVIFDSDMGTSNQWRGMPHGYGLSATEIAYPYIFLEWYLLALTTGSVVGDKISQISFVEGPGSLDIQYIEDAKRNAQTKNEAKRVVKAGNTLIIPTPNGVSLETLTVAGLPLNYDQKELTTLFDLMYARALFLDPQTLNPNLAAGNSLSSNGQIMAQDVENRGDGLFTSKMLGQHNRALGQRVELIVPIVDLKLDLRKAENDKLHIENADAIGLSGDERRSYLVQKGVIGEDVIIDPVEPVEDEDVLVEQKTAIKQLNPEFGNTTADALFDSYQEQFNELTSQALSGDIEQSQFEEDLQELQEAFIILLFLLGAGVDNRGELTAVGEAELFSELEINEERVPSLASDIYNGVFDPANLEQPQLEAVAAVSGKAVEDITAEDLAAPRLKMWESTVANALSIGKMGDPLDPMVIFVLGDTVEHCETCLRLAGQVHRISEFSSRGLIPRIKGNKNFECECWECLCFLRGTTEAARGSF